MMVSFRRPLATAVLNLFSRSASSASYTSRLLLSRRQSAVASLSLLGFVSSALPPTATCHAQQAPTETCTTTARRLQSTSRSSDSGNIMSEEDTGYLDAKSAAALDEELMSTPGFTLEQLMELAGLSVAEAVYSVVQEQRQHHDGDDDATTTTSRPKILLVCGPGNNGGDGLVAARHLHMFGYDCTVVYPKRSSRESHYVNLVQQCVDLNIPVLLEIPSTGLDSFACVVDAIFGFSFVGTPREPFASILQEIQQARQKRKNTGSSSSLLVVSVDIPSGWNVNEGDVNDSGFMPDVLVSLTAPKTCAQSFVARGGRHFVGGRFLPPALAEKYQIRMPNYPGVAQVMQVNRGGGGGESAAPGAADAVTTSWEEEYAAHLAKTEATEFAAYTKEKPSDDSWEVQYAAYLAEKEQQEKE